MTRRGGQVDSNGKVKTGRMPMGSTEDVQTIRTFGLVDSLRALKKR